MGMLLALGRLLGFEADELLTQLKRNAIVWIAIALLLLVAVAFLLLALNSWFTTLWGPIVGPLVMAGAALLTAGILYATIAVMDNMVHRRELQRRHSAERTALVTTAALAAAPVLFRSDLVRKVGIPVGSALAMLYLLSREGRDAPPPESPPPD